MVVESWNCTVYNKVFLDNKIFSLSISKPLNGNKSNKPLVKRFVFKRVTNIVREVEMAR